MIYYELIEKLKNSIKKIILLLEYTDSSNLDIDLDIIFNLIYIIVLNSDINKQPIFVISKKEVISGYKILQNDLTIPSFIFSKNQLSIYDYQLQKILIVKNKKDLSRLNNFLRELYQKF